MLMITFPYLSLWMTVSRDGIRFCEQFLAMAARDRDGFGARKRRATDACASKIRSPTIQYNGSGARAVFCDFGNVYEVERAYQSLL